MKIPFVRLEKETRGRSHLRTRHPGTKDILTNKASEKQYPRLMSMRDIIRTEADQYATVIRIRFISYQLTMSKILKKPHIE